MTQETPAPSWLPLVFFAIPVLIVGAVLAVALPARRRAKAGQSAQKTARQESDTQMGVAESIEDGGDYSVDALLKALAIKPADYGPTDDLPYDEGWSGTMLGLKSRISSSVTVLEPSLFWGSRAQGQVFIRLGPDEKVEGDTMMGTNRHIRHITVLRVEAPRAELDVAGGRPAFTDGAAPELASALASVKSNPGIWDGLRGWLGPDGIVLIRPGLQDASFWAYDLWLVERIARSMKLPPLEDARIGPSWKVPYGLGRSLTPKDWN
jgi:hypothetical protein